MRRASILLFINSNTFYPVKTYPDVLELGTLPQLKLILVSYNQTLPEESRQSSA